MNALDVVVVLVPWLCNGLGVVAVVSGLDVVKHLGMAGTSVGVV